MSVYGTGRNLSGKLAGLTGNQSTLAALTDLPSGATATALSGGSAFSVILGDNGIVYGVGNNLYGQLTGSGDATTYRALSGLPVGVLATKLSAGINYVLVLGSDGVVYGAGNNDYGQLTGVGDKTTLTALTGLPGGVLAVAIDALRGSGGATLVLGNDGVVYGSGMNTVGQLTGASSSNKTTLTALTGLPGGVLATAVSIAYDSTLVLGNNGVVYGTGKNDFGQLAGLTGNKTTLTAITALPSGATATALSGGSSFSVILGDNGVAYGVGYNSSGQLTGSGDTTAYRVLSGLPVGVLATKLSAGVESVLVLGDDGIVYGTGGNSYGQLTGVGDKATLTALTGLPGGSAGLDVAEFYSTSLVIVSDTPPPVQGISARFDLGYSDALEHRADLLYGDAIERRYDVEYDIAPSVVLSRRFEWHYDAYADNATRFDMAYDLDASAKLSARFDLSYTLLPAQAGTVQSATFTLKTQHG